ncbi:MAG TPA: tRNA 2-thiouridine(34) synthase MnmA [Phycisphaerae bacterium]|nr:tRNA 2-thiouridine(34) synthase MnmA [Phycisphaerae bacterium]
MPQKKKVVVAMSGGVDSSVAAALLQKQGYDCVGVFMRLGNDPSDLTDADVELIACSPEKRAAHEEEMRKSSGKQPKAHHQGCCSSSDAADARYVAGLLDIPFYALNFQHDFGGIIDYFVREYNRGRTPNPCVRCNEYLKFGKLSRYAKAIGADYVATGHYARIAHGPNGEPQLLRGMDTRKDQSYVLFGVPRDELAHMLLPIGDMEKSNVRQLAEELGLPVFNKPDSQEICFVPDNDYANLVARKSPETVRPGQFVDSSGKAVGDHPGHQHFTIGQRKGIGLAFGYPIYVTGIDPASNTVTLGKKEDLLHRSLTAREVNWIVGDPVGPTEPLRCRAKIRYNSEPAPATALITAPDHLTVRFDNPVLAITPGQAVVCYDLHSEQLLGGGWIDTVSE